MSLISESCSDCKKNINIFKAVYLNSKPYCKDCANKIKKNQLKEENNKLKSKEIIEINGKKYNIETEINTKLSKKEQEEAEKQLYEAYKKAPKHIKRNLKDMFYSKK